MSIKRDYTGTEYAYPSFNIAKAKTKLGADQSQAEGTQNTRSKN